MIERETSLRRIRAVLRQPDVAASFPGAQRPEFVPPAGPDVLYLRIGSGFMVYQLDGESAEAHGCLLPGDRGPHTTAAILEQFEYLFSLGVKRIWGAPVNERAERKGQALGMHNTGLRTERGFPIYEVTNG